ncbi:hypothetical protein EDD15DRAFT_2363351 [Pisolithus albus]|nr:hypothetical protein EDD15DRAFT_2363351 [Pisolithus albus]
MLGETNPPNQMLEGTHSPNQVLEGADHEIFADGGPGHYAGPPTSSFSSLLCPSQSPNPAPNAEPEGAENPPEPNQDG